MDRRKFLAAMAAGAIVTAEGLWMPGQKLISIPKKFGTPLNVWLTQGDVDVKWAVIYADKLESDGSLRYVADDLTIYPDSRIIFDRVMVENPTPYGPRRIKVPFACGSVYVDPTDKLTLQWASDGVFLIA
jgi:hypothetical protein